MSLTLITSSSFAEQERVTASNVSRCAIGTIMRKLQANGAKHIHFKYRAVETVRQNGLDFCPTCSPKDALDDLNSKRFGKATLSFTGEVRDQFGAEFPVHADVTIDFINAFDLFNRLQSTSCEASEWNVVNDLNGLNIL